jgi:nicotinamidase-related amidase
MATELELGRAALLLVDVQREFLHQDGALARAGFPSMAREDVQRLIERCQTLVTAMRQAGRPIVWVKTELRSDFADSGMATAWLQRRRQSAKQFLTEGSWGAELMDGLTVAPGDVVVIKKSHSPFIDTSLDRILTNLGVEQCVICGGGVEDSISEAARTGGRLGYEQYVVEDALYPTGDRDLKQIKSAAELVSTEEVLAAAPLTSAEEPGPAYAMLLIDMQNDFMNDDRAHVKLGLSPKLPEEKRSSILAHTRQLLDAMHERNLPVVYVRVVRREDNLDDVHTRTHRRLRTVPKGLTHCVEGTPGAEIVAEIAPIPGDFMVEKKGGSGFGYTALHRILRNLNARRLFMTGGATTGCVWATVFDGLALGYDVTVISDAVYPPDSPGLQTLAQWCTVVPSADVLEELSEIPVS